MGKTFIIGVCAIPYLVLLAVLSLPLGVYLFDKAERASIEAREPTLFPLHNTQASYTIQKEGEIYTVSYRDRKHDIDGVLIAKSATSLERYVNKHVHLSGHFERNPTTQCIAGNCHPISGVAALHIDTIAEVLR